MMALDAPVFLAHQFVDFRKSIDTLAAYVRDHFQAESRSGAVYVFLNRNKTGLKALWFDHHGYCLLYKRMERGAFRRPLIESQEGPTLSLEMHEFLVLFKGIPRPARKQKQAVDSYH